MSKKIVVIGGGASGFMAAITAAKAGASVTILEQNSKLGKKILSTGNGKCNLSNLNQQKDCYRSTENEFPYRILDKFTVEDTICFFHEIGIYTKNKNGYLYPYSEQASSVVEVLEMEARRLKIKLKTQEKVQRIEPLSDGFLVHTESWKYPCDRVIVCCGSSASVIEGSDGSGYELAKTLGHSIVKPLPALTGLKGVGSQFSKWAGVRVDAKISLLVDGEMVVSQRGEVQLTDYGISGIPVFQVSRYASRAVDEGKTVTALLDFLPDLSFIEGIELLNVRQKNRPNKTLKELLTGLFPGKLTDVLLNKVNTLEDLTQNIKKYEIKIKGTLDLDHAQVCTGGITCKEIDGETMESKLIPGIYFCGEIVDVDGTCGGYNLQWAWSSGYAAGCAAAEE